MESLIIKYKNGAEEVLTAPADRSSFHFREFLKSFNAVRLSQVSCAYISVEGLLSAFYLIKDFVIDEDAWDELMA